jgi:hypothetical protein
MTQKERTRAEILADKQRSGRPPKSIEEKQNQRLTIYVTSAERQQLLAEAKQSGLSISGLLMRPWRGKKE